MVSDVKREDVSNVETKEGVHLEGLNELLYSSWPAL